MEKHAWREWLYALDTIALEHYDECEDCECDVCRWLDDAHTYIAGRVVKASDTG